LGDSGVGELCSANLMNLMYMDLGNNKIGKVGALHLS